MKGNILIGMILLVVVLMVAGCSAPTCYPPNKILDNKCCIDSDDNSVCDYEEITVASDDTGTEKISTPVKTPTKKTPTQTETYTVDDDSDDKNPQIQTVDVPKPAPIKTGYQFGVQDIKLGESQKALEINKLSAYRSSRDKAVMNWMIFTVRNRGDKDLNAIVELLFDGATVQGTVVNVKKEYNIPVLKPGEKYVLNQSLGIRVIKINETKEMELSVYEKYVSPRKNLELITKTVIPTDYMDNLEIFTFGPED